MHLTPGWGTIAREPSLVGHNDRMPAPSGFPPELGRIFSAADALKAGVSPKRLRSSALSAPFSGSRVIPTPMTAADQFAAARDELITRCLAFGTVAPNEYCFSGVTAALLYGIPLPSRFNSAGSVDVSVPIDRTPPRHKGVRGHRLARWQVSLFLGMPLVAPELSWAQLAPELTLDELVIAGDYLVRRKRPLASLERLAASTRAVRRNSTLARQALDDIRPGTDSPPESATRLVLIRGGLPEPVVGYTVFHEGYFVGTPDLAYVEEKIAIEYQGSGHWLDRDVFDDDIIRRERFERAGWKTILITSSRLREPRGLVAEVDAVLRERASTA
jgi:hypothetical protein